VSSGGVGGNWRDATISETIGAASAATATRPRHHLIGSPATGGGDQADSEILRRIADDGSIASRAHYRVSCCSVPKTAVS
jgi:hypothetical protein